MSESCEAVVFQGIDESRVIADKAGKGPDFTAAGTVIRAIARGKGWNL